VVRVFAKMIDCYLEVSSKGQKVNPYRTVEHRNNKGAIIHSMTTQIGAQEKQGVCPG
jgi:hypothetical protein